MSDAINSIIAGVIEGGSNEAAAADTSVDVSTETEVDAGAGDSEAGAGVGDSSEPEVSAEASDDTGSGEGSDVQPDAQPDENITEAERLYREKQQAEDKELADVFGLTKEAVGKDNRLPHKRVKAMLSKGLAKEREAQNKRFAELEGNAKGWKQSHDEMNFLNNLIMSSPKQYAELLIKGNPAFADVFKEIVGVPAQAADAGMPQPDLKYEDGSVGYSSEQFNKRLVWERQQAAKEAAAASEKAVAEKLKPLEDQRKLSEQAAKYRQNASNQYREAVDALGDRLPKDGTPESKEILKVMAENPKLTILQAALKWLLPRIAADRTKMREEIIAELNKRPAAASKTTGGAIKATPAGGGSGDPINDIIAAVASGKA